MRKRSGRAAVTLRHFDVITDDGGIPTYLCHVFNLLLGIYFTVFVCNVMVIFMPFLHLHVQITYLIRLLDTNIRNRPELFWG